MKCVIVMRKLLVVVLFISIRLIAESQNLTVEGTAPDLYITHIVAPKENFYSVARLYNQAPKSIAAFNEITMEKGLTIGQRVKIPLNAQNMDVSDNSNAGERLIPLTHIVAKSETLFKIGSDLHVTAQSIRKWNNLSSDNLTQGTPLVIGYLKTNNALSSVSAEKIMQPAANKNEPVQKNAEITEPTQTATEGKKDEPFAAVSSANKEKQENPLKAETPEGSNESVNEPGKVSSDTSASVVVKDTALAVFPEDTTQPNNKGAAPVKEEPLKTQEAAKNDESKTTDRGTNKTDNSATGTFADIYALQASQKPENTKSGEAATFKSTSGWQDKKYYVLINDVAPGTILKISSSDKAVYAKVLGSVPEMKENNGLLLRISNAAASDLGIIDPEVQCADKLLSIVRLSEPGLVGWLGLVGFLIGTQVLPIFATRGLWEVVGTNAFYPHKQLVVIENTVFRSLSMRQLY
ncbi:MAG: LysM peptidoglycan-binding domain-containing protein [Segetibacter sp.]